LGAAIDSVVFVKGHSTAKYPKLTAGKTCVIFAAVHESRSRPYPDGTVGRPSSAPHWTSGTCGGKSRVVSFHLTDMHVRPPATVAGWLRGGYVNGLDLINQARRHQPTEDGDSNAQWGRGFNTADCAHLDLLAPLIRLRDS